jgi:cell division protein FtsA
VDRVIDAARAVAIPADQKILHVLPQEFIIDGQEGIREPIGMSGVRLEARVHMVTGAAARRRTSSSACSAAGSRSRTSCSSSSLRVMRADRRREGARHLPVDIGGGTTDIAVFNNGAIRHTAVIPIAGDQVTNDIAISHAYADPVRRGDQDQVRLRAVAAGQPRRNHRGAERGRSSAAATGPPDAGRGGRAAYEELFGLIRDELRRSGFENMIAAGIVLTGGSAKMEGAIELAEEVFHMPVRLGVPQHVRGLGDVVRNPIHSTGVGLLLYARSRAIARQRTYR